MKKITLNSTVLSNIKGFFNSASEFKHFKGFSAEEIQQILIIMAFVDYAKSKGLASDIELEIK